MPHTSEVLGLYPPFVWAITKRRTPTGIRQTTTIARIAPTAVMESIFLFAAVQPGHGQVKVPAMEGFRARDEWLVGARGAVSRGLVSRDCIDVDTVVSVFSWSDCGGERHVQNLVGTRDCTLTVVVGHYHAAPSSLRRSICFMDRKRGAVIVGVSDDGQFCWDDLVGVRASQLTVEIQELSGCDPSMSPCGGTADDGVLGLETAAPIYPATAVRCRGCYLSTDSPTHTAR